MAISDQFRMFKTEFAQQIIHVGVLWGFAVVQPLFSLLSDKQHTQFFIAHEIKGLDLLAFSLIFALLIPLAVVLLEWVLLKLSSRLQIVFHTAVIFFLTLLLCLPIIKQLIPNSDVIVAMGSVLIAGTLTSLYIRKSGLRSYLTMLGPVVVMLPLFFLIFTPIKKITFPKAVHSIKGPHIEANIPVVLLVFDELPISSLLAQNGKIDRKLYPNFAHLTDQSTWYRNASTVSDRTAFAVPFIFSGTIPEKFATGIYRHYPNNLFTLLGESYDLAVVESISQLCPEHLCQARNRKPWADRQLSLLADLKTLYLHIVLPKGLTATLPPIDKDWADFGEATEAMNTRKAFFDQFMALLDKDFQPERTLYALHVELPHSPWIFLPSARQYDDGSNQEAIFFGIQSIDTSKHKKHFSRWENEWVRTQAYQRHLLQLGYTDHLLGKILDRLEQKKIFDKALIVVVADHGISFNLKGDMRAVERENYASILHVPLIVKYPNQTQAVVSDIPAETTDIVPTIADVLGIKIPWRHNGVSLRQAPFPERETLTAYDRDMEKFTLPWATLSGTWTKPLRLKHSLFNSNIDGFGNLYSIGPFPQLLGTKPDNSLNPKSGYRFSVRLTQAKGLENVQPNSNYIPTLLFGEMTSTRPQAHPLPVVDLALSLNRRIVALSRAYKPAAGNTYKFYFMVPEFALKPGRNEAQVYVVNHHNGKLTLEAPSENRQP
jgi:hypothetical protein